MTALNRGNEVLGFNHSKVLQLNCGNLNTTPKWKIEITKQNTKSKLISYSKQMNITSITFNLNKQTFYFCFLLFFRFRYFLFFPVTHRLNNQKRLKV